MKFKTSYCWKLEYCRTEFSSPFLDLFWRSQNHKLLSSATSANVDPVSCWCPSISERTTCQGVAEGHQPPWQGPTSAHTSHTRTSPGVPAAAGLRFSHRLPMIIKASASRSRLLHWNTRAMVKRLHMDCIWFMVIHPIKGILIIGV